MLKEHGYQISQVSLSDPFGQSSASWSDRAIDSSAKTVNGESFPEVCYANTLIYPFLARNENKLIADILKLTDYLSSEQAIPDTATCTIAYFMFPHNPFIVDEAGNPISSAHDRDWNDNQYYLGQYKYCTKLIMKILSNIVLHEPDAVIVLQSDHGARASSDQKLFMEKFPLESMNNPLNAVYCGGKNIDIEGASSVNTMRRVLSQVLSISLEDKVVPEDTYMYK